MKKILVVWAAGAVLACGTAAWGAGFGISEGSARGNAMGTEVTADPVSASVIYNNAASMTELPGTQFEVGFTAIKPRQTVVAKTPQGDQYTHGESHWWTLPTAYMTREVNSWLWCGVGVATRVGLGAEYPERWFGRYSVTEAGLTSFEVNPSLAWRVSTNFSLAAGVRFAYFDFHLDKAVPTGEPFVDPDIMVKMTGDNIGAGYNVGAYWRVLPRWALGLAYDSPIDHEIKGDYDVEGPTGAKLGGGTVYGTFPTPGAVRLGTSVQATDKLKVNGGVAYTMWSCYDALTMHYDPALLGRRNVTSTRKDWHDSLRWQLGLEYALTEAWRVRAGYVYDLTPDPEYLVDYMVPANNRHIFSFGTGWRGESFFCDVGYTFLLIDDRQVKGHLADGVWDGYFQDGDAHMASVSVGYRF